MVSNFYPGQKPREEQASCPTRTPVFAAALSQEGFILLPSVRLDLASPESSLHAKSPQISSQRLFHPCLPFKTPNSLQSSFADLPGSRAWINTWALRISGRFAGRAAGCGAEGDLLEGALQGHVSGRSTVPFPHGRAA